MTIAESPELCRDWAGSPVSTLHPQAQRLLRIPLEQYAEEAAYVIRLELPGVDPARDVTVTVETGTLMVHAERRYTGPRDCQTEFRYGSLDRHIALPLGSSVRDVSAAYHNGILTVRIGIEPEHQHEPATVPVQVQP